MNQRRGSRWSATKAFLNPAKARPNLTIVTQAHVQKLLFEEVSGEQRCTGVQVDTKRGIETFNASREVLLSAGSIGSPQILQLSGVGNGELLKERGVAPVHNLPGVGENLQDHLQVRTIYKVNNTVTLNQRVNSLFGLAAMGIEYFLLKNWSAHHATITAGCICKGVTRISRQQTLNGTSSPLSLDKIRRPAT